MVAGPAFYHTRIMAAAMGREQPVAADTPHAHIKIRTLGELQLLVGGATQERAWNANRKAKRFFGLLLASPSHRISLDEAADALWPDGDPDKIKHSLHNEVSNLRKILSAAGARGHVELRTEHGSYRLYCADDVEITDRSFERSAERGLAAVAGRQYDEAVLLLRAAATLYRGKFFEDARYEPFAESRRAFLSELLVRCLHALAEIPSTTPDDALVWWQKAIEADPCDEAAYREVAQVCIQLNLPTKARYWLELMKTRIVQDLDVPMPNGPQSWRRSLAACMRPALRGKRLFAVAAPPTRPLTCRDSPGPPASGDQLIPPPVSAAQPGGERRIHGVNPCRAITPCLAWPKLPDLLQMAVHLDAEFHQIGDAVDPGQGGPRRHARAPSTLRHRSQLPCPTASR